MAERAGTEAMIDDERHARAGFPVGVTQEVAAPAQEVKSSAKNAAVIKIIDNDRDEITAECNGKEIRGWSYKNENERCMKIFGAHEFAEGWYMRSKTQGAG